MRFIMLEKGIFLKPFKVLQTRHCFRVWKPNFFQGLDPGADCVNSIGTAVTGRALNRYNAWAAIRKRAKAAGFLTPVGCHTWRATGITIYLENDGRLENAQKTATQLRRRFWRSGAAQRDGTASASAVGSLLAGLRSLRAVGLG